MEAGSCPTYVSVERSPDRHGGDPEQLTEAQSRRVFGFASGARHSRATYLPVTKSGRPSRGAEPFLRN